MAKFVEDLFGHTPNVSPEEKAKIQELKNKVAGFYGEESFSSKIVLNLPFVDSCGNSDVREIWLKQQAKEPDFSSRKSVEETLKGRLETRVGNGNCLLSFFIEKDVPVSERRNIADLFGKEQFGNGEEIFREMPSFEIAENENQQLVVRLKKEESGRMIELDEEKRENLQVAVPPNEKVRKLLESLNEGLYEKDEAVRLALLAAIAGESVFFLGPPGTAKSMVSRRLKEAFSDAKYFEYLMQQFSTPEELFGPISLKSLENDEYKRVTKGYLPESDVVFLDEIWKASPAIQNTLLTIINEKKFHNGNGVVEVPLKVLCAASNELPAKNLGLEALWDRFLVRAFVGPIKDEGKFLDMISLTSNAQIEVPAELKISLEELEDWRTRIEEIDVPEQIKSVITAIRREMTLKNNESKNAKENELDEPFYVSDRRWKKIVNVLRTSAFLNGRSEVDLMDCQLITYCIWNTEAQRNLAVGIVEKCVGQNGFSAETGIEDIEQEISDFDKEVENAFFEDVLEPEKEIETTIDGKPCYECSDSDGKIWYITKKTTNKSGFSSIMVYRVYDSRKKLLRELESSEFKQYGKVFKGTIGWEPRVYSIQFSPQTTTRGRKEAVWGNPNVYEATKERFDGKWKIIAGKLNEELAKLKLFEEEKQRPFEENLFAERSMKDIIMKEVKDSRMALNSCVLDLKKVREKYHPEDATAQSSSIKKIQ